MPWCEECAKYYTPNSVDADGACPKCGAQIEAPQGLGVSSSGVADDSDEKAPWHFKLMVASVAIYLGWRLVQLFA